MLRSQSREEVGRDDGDFRVKRLRRPRRSLSRSLMARKSARKFPHRRQSSAHSAHVRNQERSDSPTAVRLTSGPESPTPRDNCGSSRLRFSPPASMPAELEGNQRGSKLPSNGDGFLSFRAFVSTSLDESISPEVALDKYKAYEKRAAIEKSEQMRKVREQIFEQMRGSQLAFDTYHPLAALRRFDQRLIFARSNADEFVRNMQQGCFHELSLRALPSFVAAGDSRRGDFLVGRLAGAHLLAPHVAFDPDADAVVVQAVPANVSVWSIIDTLQDFQTLRGVCIAKPSGSSSTREVRFRFGSGAEAAAALKTLSTDPQIAAASMRPTALQTRRVLEVLILPPEMFNPERVRDDLALSAQVVQKLDALMLIPETMTEQVLGYESISIEAKLDMQVLYLRRVHHFCFYSAIWCQDEWELLQRCGASVLRVCGDGFPSVSSEGDDGRNLLVATHSSRLKNFLATAGVARPTAVNIDEEPLRSRCVALCQENVRKIAEGRFQCSRCSKFFRGAEFVIKHIRKNHADVLETLRGTMHAEAAKVAFLEEEMPSV